MRTGRPRVPGSAPPVTGGRDRALGGGSGLGVGQDVVDRVADRRQVLDLVVRDLDVELLLGRDDDLDHAERVDVQVADERLVQLDVLDLDAGDFVHDLGETLEDFFRGECHGGPFFVSSDLRGWRSAGRRALPGSEPRAAYSHGSTTT